MVKNWKSLIGAALLSISMFGAGAAFTASASAQTPIVAVVNQWRGNQNMLWVRRRVEALIDQLQRDPRDYGGHRIAAIGDLQQAREQIIDAEQYAATHGY